MHELKEQIGRMRLNFGQRSGTKGLTTLYFCGNEGRFFGGFMGSPKNTLQKNIVRGDNYYMVLHSSQNKNKKGGAN